MGETWTIDEFRKELEDLGELEVQVRLAAGVWDGPKDQKFQIAWKWLREKEQARADKAAADATFRANAALVVSGLALLISAIGLYK